MRHVETRSQPVTRVEVAEAVIGSFGEGPVPRERLLAAARRNGARDDVVKLLERLPGRSFRELRQLWAVLPEIPVSRGW